MNLTTLPVIDWELGIKLAGNKKELAEEILALFIKNLSPDYSAIHEFYVAENYTELLQRLHRLRGALCYCGLPRLKWITAQLETELKSNSQTHLSALMSQLEGEVQLLLKQYDEP